MFPVFRRNPVLHPALPGVVSAWLTGLLLVLISVVSLPSWAASSPHEMLEQATRTLVNRIEQERGRLEQEPDYAEQIVREELEPLVDFRRITRLVMAQYFDSATTDQKYRFLEVFKQGLISTYASGITLYEGQQITVLPQQDGDVNGERARVRMEINTQDGRVIPVSYSLVHKNDGWKVENVIVNGLNLGKTFRSQFDQSMQQHQGNLDQVIATWAATLESAAQANQGSSASSEQEG